MLVGLSPAPMYMCGSDSDVNVGSEELAAAADVILTTHENPEVLFEWS